MATNFQNQISDAQFGLSENLKDAAFNRNVLLGLLFGPSTGGKQIGTGGSNQGGGSTTPTTPVPTGPAAATILDTIPYVSDGDVIRAEDHNDLVAAVRLLARLVDTGEISPQIVVNAAPLIQPVNTSNTSSFAIDEGFARGPSGDPANIAGWMPLDLPDGYTLDSLRVLGSYPGTQVTDWPVSLRRVELGKEGDTTIISGNLRTGTTVLGTAFSQSFAFDARGHSRAEADELLLVDSS